MGNSEIKGVGGTTNQDQNDSVKEILLEMLRMWILTHLTPVLTKNCTLTILTE